MLKIITPVYEKHKIFLPQLIQDIKKTCDYAGIEYKHLMNSDKCWPSFSRNKLLSEINDEDYVAFIDSDDFPLNSWAKTITRYLRDHEVIYSDFIAYETGKIIKSREFDYKTFQRSDFIPFSTVAMRGYIANKIEFPPIQKAEDWVYLHKAYKLTKDFYYIPMPIIVRRTTTSINRSSIPVYRKLKRIYKDYKARCIIQSL